MILIARCGARAALALLGFALVGAKESPGAAVQVNGVGYEAAGPKLAVVAGAGDAPVAWRLVAADGATVARGRTTPYGFDAASGDRVQHVDFSAVRTTGTGFRLEVGKGASAPFAIAPRPFRRLAAAAAGFFYQQRSHVPILARFVERADLARPAGHPREELDCFAGVDERGVRWPGCPYRLDVTGGWYDAGDHGKYVVNGALSAWMLVDLHLRFPGAFPDGRLPIPEAGNGTGDLLDEARVEIKFMLAMQVPEGARLKVATRVTAGAPAGGFVEVDAGGLAHAKVADERWTPLPNAPADNREPRHLYPPTTAAALNLAATAAQASRAWRTIDPAFAGRALAAARRAWDAAARHPALLASSDFAGSGGYGDTDLDDERLWAAAELWAATGEARYRDAVAAAPARLLDAPADLSWPETAVAGLMTVATLPADSPLRARARAALFRLADRYVGERAASGYRLPFRGTRYAWGSNAVLLNRAVVLGAAWQIRREPRWRAAMIDVADYLLGRNPLGRSFVTGFGAVPMRRPHHRFWARGADPRYPPPPAGVVSGGPNTVAMTDDVAKTMRGACAPQRCWVDDHRAFTMNEVAINWNAPLLWVATVLDATAGQS